MTQNQLNSVEAPVPRDFAAGYGEILLATAVTLIYGPGMPLIYFVAAAGFTLRYWVELYCDLRIYRRPVLYSRKLVGTSFPEVLGLMMVLHAGISTIFVGMAGGENPVSSTVSMSVALRRPHALPMILCSILALGCFIFKALARTPLRNRLLKWKCSLWCLDDQVSTKQSPPRHDFQDIPERLLVIQSTVLNEELKSFSSACKYEHSAPHIDRHGCV